MFEWNGVGTVDGSFERFPARFHVRSNRIPGFRRFRHAPITPHAGKPSTPEAKWRTKGSVDFNWGFTSPEEGVNDSGTSQPSKEENLTESFVASSNLTVSDGLDTRTTPSIPRNSTPFPEDYFSARFSGFGEGVRFAKPHLALCSSYDDNALIMLPRES